MATCKETRQKLRDGAYEKTFEHLYGDKAAAQPARYIEAVEQFEALYGERDVRLYSTPGRTEIGGNHTDHNNGLVLAAAVDLDIIAVVAKNDSNIARVKSKGFSRTDVVDLAKLEASQGEFGTSAGLVRGVAAGISERGGRVGGFDAYTTSDVLRGSGLSSSAAFEVCMAEILNVEYNEGRFTPVELGIVSQYAENVYFGKPSGLMDQTACAVGSAITIDFKDPAAPIVEEIPFDLAASGHKLVITDTKGSHADLTDEYAAIRTEMERVASFFHVGVLREVPREDFFREIVELRRFVGDRAVLRAIHYYEECRRVGALSGAIREGDIERFKATIVEGGHSSFEYNQNAYSVKSPAEQGVSLGLALSQTILNGRGAWRLQGGGFAGTIQAFVPADLLDAYTATLRGVFGDDACYVLSVRPVGTTEVKPA